MSRLKWAAEILSMISCLYINLVQKDLHPSKTRKLENDVFCGPSCVFTNVENPRAHVSRKHAVQQTTVRVGATRGANVTIVWGCTLGEYCFIGAAAVVTRDVPPHTLVVGSPARQIGWVYTCGERLPEDLACPACGKAYRQSSVGLIEIGGQKS